MATYAIYLRKSRADTEAEARGEMETLARHEKQLTELAHKMKLPIDKIYKEIVSGETIAARPVMQQLLQDVEQGRWSGVLVTEIERLARGDTIDQGIVAQTFKAGNTKIITPAKTYDPNDEFDEEYFEFGLFMSRREYKTINRRIQRGRLTSVKEGKFISSVPPYGYNKAKLPDDKGYSLVINEAESNVVQLIYDLYIKGRGMAAIAGELDKMGIKPRYRDTWSKSTISDILKNPVYIGKIRWSYRPEKKSNADGKITKKRKVNNDCILVTGKHPAIIEEAVFNQAQAVRKQKTQQCTKRDLTLKNPLSGIIYCSKCRSLMTRLGENKKKQYAALKCSNRHCDNVSAPLYLIEKKLINALTEWLYDYEIQISLNYNKVSKKQTDVKLQSLHSLKNEIEQVDRQINNTYNLLEREVYSVETFTKRNEELSEKKKQLLSALTELEVQYNSSVGLDEIKNVRIPQIKKLLYEYPSITSAQKKNQILKTILYRAEYLKGAPNRRGRLNNCNFELVLYPALLPLKELI